jgi:hypothetical protein
MKCLEKTLEAWWLVEQGLRGDHHEKRQQNHN